MRKLILWNMVTLDGMFEGPDRDISWFVFDDELEKYILESQAEADTLLFGRVTYQLMADYWPKAEGTIAEFMNRVPKIVFSRTLAGVDWANTRLVKDNAPDEIAKIKRQPGGDIFVFGSADFSRTLMRHSLVDEYRFGINPVVLGKGIPFFKGGEPQTGLKLIETRPLNSGLVILHYEPVRKE
jgi:dihydrofolate reductase